MPDDLSDVAAFGVGLVYMVRGKKEIREFYERWGASVLAFCRLFLGDEAQAQEATAQTFLVYLRGDSALREDRLPLPLLRCAVDAVRDKCSPPASQEQNGQNLKSTILLLPCEQRAVFILHTVLHLDEASVAVATGFSVETVRKLSFRSLMRIRELLPRDFFEERIR